MGGAGEPITGKSLTLDLIPSIILRPIRLKLMYHVYLPRLVYVNKSSKHTPVILLRLISNH